MILPAWGFSQNSSWGPLLFPLQGLNKWQSTEAAGFTLRRSQAWGGIRYFCVYRDENLCSDSMRQEINEGFYFLLSPQRQEADRSLRKGVERCLRASFWVLFSTKNTTGVGFTCSIVLCKTQTFSPCFMKTFFKSHAVLINMDNFNKRKTP